MTTVQCWSMCGNGDPHPERGCDTTIEMKQLAEQLVNAIAAADLRLRDFDDSAAAHKTAAGVWSKKELLGHLIDSASNNHQRFVRLQLADDLRLPKYEQEGWVRVQGYQTADWISLIALWRAYNLHLARLIRDAAPDALQHTCRVGDGEPVTLQFLMEDYVAHLEHHLLQLL